MGMGLRLNWGPRLKSHSQPVSGHFEGRGMVTRDIVVDEKIPCIDVKSASWPFPFRTLIPPFHEEEDF